MVKYNAKTLGSLKQYYRDKSNSTITDSESFKFKIMTAGG